MPRLISFAKKPDWLTSGRPNQLNTHAGQFSVGQRGGRLSESGPARDWFGEARYSAFKSHDPQHYCTDMWMGWRGSAVSDSNPPVTGSNSKLKGLRWPENQAKP